MDHPPHLVWITDLRKFFKGFASSSDNYSEVRVELELRIFPHGPKSHSFHEFLMEPAGLCGVSERTDTGKGCMPSIQNNLVAYQWSIDDEEFKEYVCELEKK
jgi:hypothetical protein